MTNCAGRKIPPESTSRMADSITAELEDFGMKPKAPAAMTTCMISLVSLEESMTTGNCGWASFTCLMLAGISMPGMLRSNSIRSTSG